MPVATKPAPAAPASPAQTAPAPEQGAAISRSADGAQGSIFGFNGHRRTPPPINEPIRSYAPGTPERAELKARLDSMAAERIDIPIVIDGREIRTGDTTRVVMPHAHQHVLAEWHGATASHVGSGDRRRRARTRGLGQLAVRGARGRLPSRRRAALHPLSRDAQRRDDARPIQDGVPGRGRCGVRARRLLALQRALRREAVQRSADQRSWRLEPDGLPPARGIHLRRDAVQLHGDRRQSADGARADGKHRDLEAVVDGNAERVLRAADSHGGRAAAGRDQLPHGRRGHDLERRALASPFRGAALHRKHHRLQHDVEADRREHVELPHVSAHRRRDGREGLHRRASDRRTPRRSRSRSSAADSSTRDRSARPRAACTSRSRCGARCATAWSR